MTTEQLRTRLQKREEESKDLKKQIKEVEAAETNIAEQAAKLEAIAPQIAEAVKAILDKEGIVFPEGKQIILVAGANGELLTNILNGKPVKTRAGNGGVKAITYDGQQTSWAKLCETKNITRTPSGSAHRDVHNKAKELHDTIQHHCSIDDKDYPETGTES